MEICCFPSELSERAIDGHYDRQLAELELAAERQRWPTSCGSESPQRDRL